MPGKPAGKPHPGPFVQGIARGAIEPRNGTIPLHGAPTPRPGAHPVSEGKQPKPLKGPQPILLKGAQPAPNGGKPLNPLPNGPHPKPFKFCKPPK